MMKAKFLSLSQHLILKVAKMTRKEKTSELDKYAKEMRNQVKNIILGPFLII